MMSFPIHSWGCVAHCTCRRCEMGVALPQPSAGSLMAALHSGSCMIWVCWASDVVALACLGNPRIRAS